MLDTSISLPVTSRNKRTPVLDEKLAALSRSGVLALECSENRSQTITRLTRFSSQGQECRNNCSTITLCCHKIVGKVFSFVEDDDEDSSRSLWLGKICVVSDKFLIQGDKRIAHATHAELKSIAQIGENFLHVRV